MRVTFLSLLFLAVFSFLGAIALHQINEDKYFDKFAKELTRELGNNFDGITATKAVEDYLADLEVDDAFSYFQENMAEFSSLYKNTDEDLDVNDRLFLDKYSADWSQSFYVTFPIFPFGKRELRIHIFGHPDGSITFRAITIIHSL